MTTTINHYIQDANHRVNCRFKPKTILNHEKQWMNALYKRYQFLMTEDSTEFVTCKICGNEEKIKGESCEMCNDWKMD